MSEQEMGYSPRQIVETLSKYIIGQDQAKKAVAIAVRNRARRQFVGPEMKDEIAPKNIIMVGPTGVGKTEIARRLSSLTRAPFVKVEATKYTEVGYVGRDVESMIRDLATVSINMVKRAHQEQVRAAAEKNVEERLLDLLLPAPGKSSGIKGSAMFELFTNEAQQDSAKNTELSPEAEKQKVQDEQLFARTREKFRKKLQSKELEENMINIEVSSSSAAMVEVFPSTGMEDMDINIQNMLSNFMPERKKQKRVPVAEARNILMQQEMDRLIDMDKVVEEAISRAENQGIVFIDEIDKIAGKESGHGPDVSREGVQRDILPIIEGCTVNTRYGQVRTDHILFIGAGAFHTSRPSDLIPELQGRFPIQVELDSLTREDLKRILTTPKNALLKQYQALMETEGVKIKFNSSAVDEIARIAEWVNRKTENIGARRLHTIMEKLLEEISFTAPEMAGTVVSIDKAYVYNTLSGLLEDRDLSNYIL